MSENSRKIAREAFAVVKAQENAPPAEMIFQKFSDIKPKILDWLWKNRLPAGKLIMIVGDAGLGKSMWTCDAAAVVSNSGVLGEKTWPDGSRVPKSCKGDVLFIASEDNPEDTIWGRLKAAKADMSRVEVLRKTVRGDQREIWTLDKVTELENHLQNARELGVYYSLLVIDPIDSYLPRGVDGYNQAEVRGLLDPLIELADIWKLTILGVKHPPKSAQKAVHAASGSVAWIAAARAAFMVAKDPDDPDLVLFMSVKANLTARPTGMAYRIESTVVAGGSVGPIETAKIVWEEGNFDRTADDVLNGTSKPTKDRDTLKFNEAKQFIKDSLANGPRFSSEMQDLAKQRGITPKTLRDAREALMVETGQPKGRGAAPKHSWWLPEQTIN